MSKYCSRWIVQQWGIWDLPSSSPSPATASLQPHYPHCISTSPRRKGRGVSGQFLLWSMAGEQQDTYLYRLEKCFSPSWMEESLVFIQPCSFTFETAALPCLCCWEILTQHYCSFLKFQSLEISQSSAVEHHLERNYMHILNTGDSGQKSLWL